MQPDAVLVTGAAGFIGSHLCEALLARGVSVVGLDNFDPYYPPALKQRNIQEVQATARSLSANFRLVERDVCDTDTVRRLFCEQEFRAVMHLAAKAGICPSLRDLLGYARVNVLGTLTVLEQARRHGCPRFLLASSSSVYGASSAEAFVEDHSLPAPRSPYAASKLAAEEYCQVYHRLYGLPVICLRIFSAYGPRQRPDLAVHKFLRLIMAGEPVPRYGSGESSRDYTYVEDVVAGFLAALDRELPWGVINLGSGRPVTLQELIAALETVCGRQARIQELPAPPGEMLRTQASLQRARRLLDWTPQVDLHEGLERFFRWWQTHPDS